MNKENKQISIGYFRSIFNEVMAKYNGSLHKTLQVLGVSREFVAKFLDKEDEHLLPDYISKEILQMYKFDQQYPLSVKKKTSKKND
jgi:hypothetical protein